jgi:eukaryotic-like serine/threonine-protein kinase
MMQPQVVSAIREQSGGQYEALGPLAEDERGTLIYLARKVMGRTLVAVRLDPSAPRPDGSREYTISILPELDDSIPAVPRPCISCGASITDWRRFCAVCGTDQADPTGGRLAGVSKSEILQSVREAAGAEFEVLGEMPRVGGGAPVYFAREIASGKVVTLSLRREADGGGSESYSVGVTTLIQTGPRRIPGVPTPTPLPAPGPASGHPSAPPPREAAPHGETAPETRRVCPTCREEFGPEVRFCPTDGSVLTRAGVADDGLVGRVIADRYRILGRIGEGGFGQVYLAEHSKMRRRCAIKVMNPGLRHDAEALERFTREAANSSQINHPNVATIYDFGETADGVIYLAMEFVEGETLADMLARERPFHALRSVEIARQIAEALIAAHNLGIVHRDLKPYNIILATTHDGSDLVKVVDFGIAKAVQGTSQGLTRAGYVIGTPEYMSPEQLVGDPVDGRSDIYSVGCILFEMISGEQTFSGPSLQILSRRLTEDPPRLRDLVPDVSQVLDDIVARALARDPASRFQSAEGLRDALSGATRAITGERIITFRRSTEEREAQDGLAPPLAETATPPPASAPSPTPAPTPVATPTPRPTPRRPLRSPLRLRVRLRRPLRSRLRVRLRPRLRSRLRPRLRPGPSRSPAPASRRGRCPRIRRRRWRLAARSAG